MPYQTSRKTLMNRPMDNLIEKYTDMLEFGRCECVNVPSEIVRDVLEGVCIEDFLTRYAERKDAKNLRCLLRSVSINQKMFLYYSHLACIESFWDEEVVKVLEEKKKEFPGEDFAFYISTLNIKIKDTERYKKMVRKGDKSYTAKDIVEYVHTSRLSNEEMRRRAMDVLGEIV